MQADPGADREVAAQCDSRTDRIFDSGFYQFKFDRGCTRVVFACACDFEIFVAVSVKGVLAHQSPFW